MTTNNPRPGTQQGQTQTPPGSKPPFLIARNLLSFSRPEEADASELLKTRYLCRGGGLLICGATGIGKSSLALQLAMLWAIGKGDFGLLPNKPLKVLLIQAENDDGDIAEFRDGVCAGYNFTASEMREASDNVVVHYETKNRGKYFDSQVLTPLLNHHTPDMVIVDHALAYLGGDARSAKDVGDFLRGYLDPAIDKAQCGLVMLHHTPKPSQDKRSSWASGDFAYAGLGSIEWPGWARAVLLVRDVKEGNVFELRAPKRGQRLGWTDFDGKKTDHIYIAHCSDKICWRAATKDEVPITTPRTKAKHSIEDYFNIILHHGTNGITPLEWNRIAAEDLDIPKTTCSKFRTALKAANRVYYVPDTRLWHFFH